MREEAKTNVLLAQWQGGEGNARNALIARLHPELLNAGARLRQDRDSSLSTGDLINDAVLRIMRHILVDHARATASSPVGND